MLLLDTWTKCYRHNNLLCATILQFSTYYLPNGSNHKVNACYFALYEEGDHEVKHINGVWSNFLDLQLVAIGRSVNKSVLYVQKILIETCYAFFKNSYIDIEFGGIPVIPYIEK